MSVPSLVAETIFSFLKNQHNDIILLISSEYTYFTAKPKVSIDMHEVHSLDICTIQNKKYFSKGNVIRYICKHNKDNDVTGYLLERSIQNDDIRTIKYIITHSELTKDKLISCISYLFNIDRLKTLKYTLITMSKIIGDWKFIPSCIYSEGSFSLVKYLCKKSSFSYRRGDVCNTELFKENGLRVLKFLCENHMVDYTGSWLPFLECKNLKLLKYLCKRFSIVKMGSIPVVGYITIMASKNNLRAVKFLLRQFKELEYSITKDFIINISKFNCFDVIKYFIKHYKFEEPEKVLKGVISKSNNYGRSKIKWYCDRKLNRAYKKQRVE